MNPGFAQLLAAVAAGVCRQVRHVRVTESVDVSLFAADSNMDDARVGPSRREAPATPTASREAVAVFADALDVLAELFGVTLDERRCTVDFAHATKDLDLPGRPIAGRARRRSRRPLGRRRRRQRRARAPPALGHGLEHRARVAGRARLPRRDRRRAEDPDEARDLAAPGGSLDAHPRRHPRHRHDDHRAAGRERDPGGLSTRRRASVPTPISRSSPRAAGSRRSRRSDQLTISLVCRTGAIVV